MTRPVRPGSVLLAASVLMLAIDAPLRAQAANAVGLPLGATPPAVQIEDLDGRPADLAAQPGGRPLVIEFWATWCPVCEELLPRMQAAHARFGARAEFLVVAVAVNQSPRTIKRHLDRHPQPFRFLWDTRGNATRALKAPTTSYIVILDASGRVAYTGVGADQDIAGVLERLIDG